jgi:hypothetical protein
MRACTAGAEHPPAPQRPRTSSGPGAPQAAAAPDGLLPGVGGHHPGGAPGGRAAGGGRHQRCGAVGGGGRRAALGTAPRLRHTGALVRATILGTLGTSTGTLYGGMGPAPHTQQPDSPLHSHFDSLEVSPGTEAASCNGVCYRLPVLASSGAPDEQHLGVAGCGSGYGGGFDRRAMVLGHAGGPCLLVCCRNVFGHMASTVAVANTIELCPEAGVLLQPSPAPALGVSSIRHTTLGVTY